ncbi:hypothetical protein CIC12_28760 [Burkholderia sp. SG-MS1]|uniref:hypothetical protein n=1 Tax=Paraburkholderia sp. SG-MS1 TaxID=2023741 RepID=UPI001447F482|nr:hypothetical protein [Paraburkholderia sp. SG-MS1]
MAVALYEEKRPLTVELDGNFYNGSYRVLDGTVIVYFGLDIRTAHCGMDRPETVARWLLLDVCRKAEAKKRKAASTLRRPGLASR